MKKASRTRQSRRSTWLAAMVWIVWDSAYRGRTVVVAAILLVSLSFIGMTIWRKWSPIIRNRGEYVITADRVLLSPPPSWLKADVEAEMLENVGLAGTLTLIDDDLADRIMQALELNPWVDCVTRVDVRFPARIEAQVTYRVPFAAVVPRSDRQAAPVPIDAKGVALPADDMPPSMLARLPRIADAGQVPLVGQIVDGPRIAGALALIRFLREDWDALNLWNVTPLRQPESRGEERFYLYDLTSSGGTRIHWGAAPGAAPAAESSPRQKLARLKDYVETHEVDLRSVQAPEMIDVRRSLQVKPRTAGRPNEPSR